MHQLRPGLHWLPGRRLSEVGTRVRETRRLLAGRGQDLAELWFLAARRAGGAGAHAAHRVESAEARHEDTLLREEHREGLLDLRGERDVLGKYIHCPVYVLPGAEGLGALREEAE